MSKAPRRKARVVMLTSGRAPKGVENFRTVNSLSKTSGYSANHLRRLLQMGKVGGVKVGNMWLAKRSDVKAYASTANGEHSRRRSSRQ